MKLFEKAATVVLYYLQPRLKQLSGVRINSKCSFKRTVLQFELRHLSSGDIVSCKETNKEQIKSNQTTFPVKNHRFHRVLRLYVRVFNSAVLNYYFTSQLVTTQAVIGQFGGL